MNSKNVSQVGQDARDLIIMGVEVNVDIAADEPQMPQGLDSAILKLMTKHGPIAILEALHDAAWGAAEMNEEEDEIACLRLRIFGKRLGTALETLK